MGGKDNERRDKAKKIISYVFFPITLIGALADHIEEEKANKEISRKAREYGLRSGRHDSRRP